MLAIILKILSILGIILLVLLGLVLLVLFFPISYSVDGVKNPQTTYLKIKVRWLFGIVRAGVMYPQPGRILVKVLCFTLFDSQATPDTKKKNKAKKTKSGSSEQENAVNVTRQDKTVQEKSGHTVTSDSEQTTDRTEQTASHKNSFQAETESESVTTDAFTRKEKLFAKYDKIKYTIKKIYDKIKHIYEEISYYKELLQDEETKLLFSHACKRIGNVLRKICPRKIKANILYGTGSPDTTGYVFALYGMLCPMLGKDVYITPDFTEQILEGTFYAKGHITVFTILLNACALALDKRLKLLITRIKKHKEATERHGN